MNTLVIILGIVFIAGFILLNKFKGIKIFNKKPKQKKKSKRIKFTGLAFDFCNMTNVRRLSLNMGIVRGNDILTKFAKEHCEYMVEKNIASHDNKRKRHIDLREYDFGAIDEITSTWYGNKRMFDAYLKSPNHRRKIEDKRFTEVGIYIEDIEDKLFHVAIFANKKNLTKI